MLKKTALSFVIIILFVFLVGCSNDDNLCNGQNSESLPVLSEYTYHITEYMQLPNYLGNVSNVLYHDEKVLFTTNNFIHYDDENPYLFNNIYDIFAINVDGTELIRMDEYNPARDMPDNTAGNIIIAGMAGCSDSDIWIIETWDFYEFNLPAGFSFENETPWDYKVSLDSGILLRKLDTIGSEIISLNITELIGHREYYNITAFSVYNNTNDSENQYIYIGVENDTDSFGTTVYVLDENGNIQFEYITEYVVQNFIKLADGTIVMSPNLSFPYRNNNEQIVIQTFDVITKTLGQTIELPLFIQQTPQIIDFVKCHGSGNIDSLNDLLISNSVGLYRYLIDESYTIELLNWEEVNIEANYVIDVFELNSDKIVCIIINPTADTYDVIILDRILRSEIPERITLTLAGFNISIQTRNSVIEFNRKNPEYNIVVRDYNEGFDSIDWDTGFNIMLTEITAGILPDILDMTYLYGSEVVDSGLFENLYTFIDNDSTLERNDFIQAALRSCEIDKELYMAPTGFTINTIVGNPAVLGTDMGWNTDEFISTLEENPYSDIPLGYYQTNITFLQSLLSVNIDKFIDRNTGTTYFDSYDFIQLLEIANRFPNTLNTDVTTGNYENILSRESEIIANGRQIMLPVQINSFNYFQREAAFGRTWYNGELVCKGYPNTNRNGHIINIEDGFAIISSSPNKEVAWLFIRTMLETDRQLRSLFYFPVNAAAFEQKLSMEQNRLLGERYFIEGTAVNLEKTTQSQIDMILAILDSLNDSYNLSIDPILMIIITEAAMEYFNGRWSAEETARIIQSKAEIYISERT